MDLPWIGGGRAHGSMQDQAYRASGMVSVITFSHLRRRKIQMVEWQVEEA
jgi:hypothetical protein